MKYRKQWHDQFIVKWKMENGVRIGREPLMTTLKSQAWHEPFLVSVAIFVWLATTAWTHSLIIPDEGRYVGVAWEMLRSGNWLTPTLDGLPFFHKPPLFYWITAASMSLFGANEWAARAAPILGAWLGAFSLYMFTRRWVGNPTARMTTLALAVQPLFFLGGQFANMDMLVAGCITSTVLMAAEAVLLTERELPLGWSLAGAYAMAGLGVLSKGLIGVAIPALIIFAWLLTTNRWRRLPCLLWIPGMAIFLAITAPWFIVMQLKFAGFSYYFFVVQHFQRFVGVGFNNMQPLLYYPIVLLVSTLAWIPWLYRIFTPSYLTLSRHDPIRWLMWVWLVVVVAFFSVPESKLLGYVLPAIAPLAFLLADCLTVLQAPSQRMKYVWFSSAGISAVVGLSVVTWFSVHPMNSSSDVATVLQSRRAPHEPIYMLNHYYYDVPFYADIFVPITVVDDWTSSDVNMSDNWRKELADAGKFSPEKAVLRLISPIQLPAALCRSNVSWIIVPANVKGSYETLNTALEVFTNQGTTLLRIDTTQPDMSSALHCTGRIHDASVNR